MNYAFFLLVLVAPCLARMPIPVPSNYAKALYRVDHEPYIIGGEDADENEWPWQGYMEYFGSFYCGVTIISEEWVLSAAHCVYGASPNQINVGLGCTDRPCDLYDVDEVIEHPDFIWIPAQGDDVGVMHLTEPLEFSDSIQAIYISDETDIDTWADESGCYITGWGNTDSGNLADVLQEANVDVYTIAECEAEWGASEIDNEEHVCVGVEGQSGSCNGDSGGPAVCPDGNGGYVQIGITSWGATGCNTNLPSVYTNAAYFKSWVSENCDGCV